MHKILYIEDNFQNYRLVMRMLQLEPDDYEVKQAVDGTTGLELVNEMVPDLIFMDINLPDIDGEEVTRRIKADPKLSTIPVIALTANAMVGDRERYLKAGCDDYLRKPISRADLKGMLKQHLHRNGGSPIKNELRI